MVDSIKTPYRNTGIRNAPVSPVTGTHATTTEKDERSPDHPLYTFDRRKTKDRRLRGNAPRALYDLRSGKDRRRRSGVHRNITIKV